MKRRTYPTVAVRALAIALFTATAASGQQLKLVDRTPDPHGSPRPARGAADVPLATSLYFELTIVPEPNGDEVLPESVSVRLQSAGKESIDLVQPGQRFAEGASGWLRARQGLFQKSTPLAVYVEPGRPLKPSTTYTVRVQARSAKGAELDETSGVWKFTTEAADPIDAIPYRLDLGTEPVRWHGAFFSGICNVVFSTRAEVFGSTYDLMDEARKRHPKAWSYQRDFWMTGTEGRTRLLPHGLPNIVCERETRRIAAMDPHDGGVLLHVEDVFGHQQYGIPANRPLSEDYHPGDEVLVADGVSDARAKVRAVDDNARTVLIGPIPTPEGGWKIAYSGPLPQQEDPDAPGLFPPGGCYLRKFRPHGTACYYWGRLDKEWDLVHRRYRRKLLVNFADTPWDLAVDGRSWTAPKDYAQWHEVARTITGHLIDRYGDDALEFTYSIFNEPDLGPMFWRASWDELQRYYDYTTDAVLRAFEDRGYDSEKVFIGGLELGGIFGVHMRLQEFLAHCSPHASAKGELPLNAAYADKRLDGKRSRRVESLCRQRGGQGSPCDFISIHAYNRSELMAAKLIRAKEIALEMDEEYYRDLWVNSHESCPDWSPPPDEAAAETYLGNGYFPSWCVDVVARQLARAAADPRFAYGETLLTVWPPVQNFVALNTVTRILDCDDDGDGRADRKVTVPAPIFHALGMLSDLGDRCWVLPQQTLGGRTIGGFASRDDGGVVRVVLYSHNAADTQARSQAACDIELELDRLGWDGPAHVEQYRFDKEHNTYFHMAKALSRRPGPAGKADSVQLAAALKALEAEQPQAQLEALKSLEKLGPAAVAEAFGVLYRLAEQSKDEAVRDTARDLLKRSFEAAHGRRVFSRAEVEKVQELAQCRPMDAGKSECNAGGRLRLTARVAGNGLNFLVIRPASD